jgi:hypothetical protein
MASIIFPIYEYYKKFFNLTYIDYNVSFHSFYAGGLVGFFQSFLCTPLELIKINLQVINIKNIRNFIFQIIILFLSQKK